MIRTSLAVALLATGCAHAAEQAPPKPAEREVIAVDTPAPEPEPEPVQRGRPRLSQTVTLGQGDYAPMPQPGAPTAAQQGVVVNNNITIVNQQPAMYGYGGYYGGYYGGNGGQAYGSHTVSRVDGNTPVRPGYTSVPGSWAGAQGTARPGHTPGVGGNWSSPPSYGPRQMK